MVDVIQKLQAAAKEAAAKAAAAAVGAISAEEAEAAAQEDVLDAEVRPVRPHAKRGLPWARGPASRASASQAAGCRPAAAVARRWEGAQLAADGAAAAAQAEDAEQAAQVDAEAAPAAAVPAAVPRQTAAQKDAGQPAVHLGAAAWLCHLAVAAQCWLACAPT